MLKHNNNTCELHKRVTPKTNVVQKQFSLRNIINNYKDYIALNVKLLNKKTEIVFSYKKKTQKKKFFYSVTTPDKHLSFEKKHYQFKGLLKKLNDSPQ